MRIAIGGCRDYEEYREFCEFVSMCMEKMEREEVVILSGHCSGVDLMAERYAAENGITLEIFPANWAKYGRAAGPVRNKQMVERADAVIAFWDGKSKGTASLLQYAKKLRKQVYLKDI